VLGVGVGVKTRVGDECTLELVCAAGELVCALELETALVPTLDVVAGELVTPGVDVATVLADELCALELGATLVPILEVVACEEEVTGVLVTPGVEV